MNKLVISTVASFLLVFTGSIAVAQTARARIADAPIRAEASLTSAIIGTLKEGGPVDVVDLQGDWYRVLVPSEQGKARVGYVLAHLIEIINADGSPQSVPAPPTSPAARPIAQGPLIPPTLAPLSMQRDKQTKREKALKAKADTLQAEFIALQNDQPIRQIPSGEMPQPMAQRSQAREGLWFNAGLGFGSLGCNGCNFTLSGLSGGLSLGGTINDRLLLGVGSTGYYKSAGVSTLSAGTLDARLRFYPIRASGFFLTGGLGLGHISIDRATEYGVGVILGLGWDIRVRSNLSLTPFWNGVGISTPNANVGVGQVGIGITVQ